MVVWISKLAKIATQNLLFGILVIIISFRSFRKQFSKNNSFLYIMTNDYVDLSNFTKHCFAFLKALSVTPTQKKSEAHPLLRNEPRSAFYSIYFNYSGISARPARIARIAIAHSRRLRSISQPTWLGRVTSPLTL